MQNLVINTTKILKSDGIIAFPTDTVYGLAVIMNNSKAIKKLYQLKGRPKQKPMVVMVANINRLKKIAYVPQRILPILKKNWPGPFTFIFRKKKIVPNFICKRGKVAVRIPDHKIPLSILRRLKKPLVVTSANISGQSEAVTAQQVKKYFCQKVDYIFDGGKCPLGTPSAVIDLTTKPPKILRRGAKIFQTDNNNLKYYEAKSTQ